MATQASETGEHYKALENETAAATFQYTAARVPERTALKTLDGSVEISWGDYNERVKNAAAGLAALGVKKGDTIALMMVNRPEFHIADAAAMHLGATPWSIYNTYTPDQIAFLVEDAAPKVAFTEQQFVERLTEVMGRDNDLETIVVDDVAAPEGGITLDALEAKGKENEGFDFYAAWRAVGPDDIL